MLKRDLKTPFVDMQGGCVVLDRPNPNPSPKVNLKLSLSLSKCSADERDEIKAR
jgi:hypothetical protein